MGKFIYTFKRYEKKYLIDEKQYTALLERIRYKMLPDSYGTTTICNLYYDTPDKLLIRRSLDKPLYKEKLRLRCYDVPKDNSMAFIEIKKKFRGIVYKRRLAVTYKQARDYLPNGYLEVENQIKKEIDWFCRSYENLTPAVALFYTRTAYFSKENPDLRITFDKDICYRNNDLELSLGSYGTKLLKEGQYLMEIKIPAAMPVWLAHDLSELSIHPTSFSKYGRAFLKNIESFGGIKNA